MILLSYSSVPFPFRFHKRFVAGRRVRLGADLETRTSRLPRFKSVQIVLSSPRVVKNVIDITGGFDMRHQRLSENVLLDSNDGIDSISMYKL